MAGPERVKTGRVEGPGGTRVQVDFYDDESIRVKVSRSPMAIEEAFLTGGGKRLTIIKLVPRG